MKSIFFTLLLTFLAYGEMQGQDIPSLVKKVYPLIEGGKYKNGLRILNDIQEQDVENMEDSCAMMFYYEKGSCLYFLENYKEAISNLNKALLRMEKLPHEDCLYLELIYGIGSSYKHLQQYENAEKYFRRVIIRSRTLGFKCSITTQSLSELSEVYNKLGLTQLAKNCSEKINSEINDLKYENWSDKEHDLFYLAKSYKELGKIEEEIEIYHRILDLIESETGIINEKYLSYTSILVERLLSNNRIDDIIPIIDNIISSSDAYKNSKMVDEYAAQILYWAVDCINLNKIETCNKLLNVANSLYDTLEDKTKVIYNSQYGYIEIARGNHANAVNILKKGIDLCFGEENSWLINIYHNLGRAYMLMKDFENAKIYLNKSKNLQLQLNGEVLQRTLDYIKECEGK